MDDRRKELIIQLREKLNKFIRLVNPFSDNCLEGDSILYLILNTDIDVILNSSAESWDISVKIMLENKEVFRITSKVYRCGRISLHFTFYYEDKEFYLSVVNGVFSVSFCGFVFEQDGSVVSNDDLELIIGKLQYYDVIIRELIANNSSTKIVGDIRKKELNNNK